MDDTILAGRLHAFVALDFGEGVDLERASGLVAAGTPPLARRRRTPTSIYFRPPPLRVPGTPVTLELPVLGRVEAAVETAVFDFAAVSVALRMDFRVPAAELPRLAPALADSSLVAAAAREVARALFERLQSAIDRPRMSLLSEEYFVFELPPGAPLPDAATLVDQRAPWLAGLVRLEDSPLSRDETAEALRLRLMYGPDDLFVCDWSAAVLVDRDCDETLQTIEFANVQLLEFRDLDEHLDDRLAEAYRTIGPLAHGWLPFWKTHTRPLRVLGQLRVEANDQFERTGNVLKLVGDQYLARVYRMLATRFHLADWEQNIKQALDVLEGAYQVVSDQSATYRTELLEVIIIVLILFEIAMAFIPH